MFPIKPLLSLLSPAGERARLSVLIFHRVLAVPDPIFPGEVDARQFDEILGWVKGWCHVLPIDDAMARLKSGSLPPRAAVITFDDGYADNHEVALPILKRHGMSACFFVATGFLDGGRMWNDTVIESIRHTVASELDLGGLGLPDLGRADRWRTDTPQARRLAIESVIGRIKYAEPAQRQAWVDAVAERAASPLTDTLMMRSEQVRSLRRAGMHIGAHTHTHPILAGLDRQLVRSEIGRSKRSLEDLLGESVDFFAYPNGRPGQDYVDDNVAVVRELGFEAAVSTAYGAADGTTDRFQLPRFTPWDRSRARFGLRMCRNLMAPRGQRA